MLPLPPLPFPKLPPLPIPKIDAAKAYRAVQAGDDYVQVRYLGKPDDAAARVEFVAHGVRFEGSSMVPTEGTLHMYKSPTEDAYVYRWRK